MTMLRAFGGPISSKPQLRARCLLVAAGLGILLLVAPTAARADLLTIVNAGFEDPVLADQTWTTGSLPGWVGTGEFGAYNPGAASIPAEAPEGLNVSYLVDRGTASASISQVLVDVLQVGTYTLSFWTGAAGDQDLNWEAQLLAGATTIASISDTGQADGVFRFVSLAHHVNVGNPLLGQPLQILFRTTTFGTRVNAPEFDDVRLDYRTTSVPEPSSLALLGAGAAALLGLSRIRAARNRFTRHS